MKTLFEGAVKSGQSVLVFGAETSLARLLAALGPVQALDVRNPSHEPEERELRARAARQLGKDGTLVLLLGSRVSPAVRAVISEVMEGRLAVGPGEQRRLARGRVVALAPAGLPGPEISELFALRINAARALAVPRACA